MGIVKTLMKPLFCIIVLKRVCVLHLDISLLDIFHSFMLIFLGFYMSSSCYCCVRCQILA